MILKVYSVFDSAANAYLQPFFAPTDGLAIRSFMDACNDASHQFHKHGLDYSLYLLGDFDDHLGTFSASQPPVKLMTGIDATMKTVS